MHGFLVELKFCDELPKSMWIIWGGVMDNISEELMGNIKTVTDNIISLIESGEPLPWESGFFVGKYGPYNLRSNEPYSLINSFYLNIVILNEKYSTPAFLTKKQASLLGGRVKDKEVPYLIIQHFSTGKKKNREEEELYYRYIGSKTCEVYNADQCEGLRKEPRPLASPIKRPFIKQFSRIEEADLFIRTINPTIKHRRMRGAKAFYDPTEDYIGIPFNPSTFRMPNSWYSTLFHELTHWTGHHSRCYRNQENYKGSEGFAKEELVAEFGAAILCDRFGVDYNLKYHASYIQHFHTLLKSEPHALIEAVFSAQKAIRYLDRVIKKATKRK